MNFVVMCRAADGEVTGVWGPFDDEAQADRWSSMWLRFMQHTYPDQQFNGELIVTQLDNPYTALMTEQQRHDSWVK